MKIAEKLSIIQNMVMDAGATHAAVICQQDILYDKVFRDICAANSCGNYGMCYMCPPDIGDIEQLMQEAQGYAAGVLYQTISEIEDSFDFEGMVTAGKLHNECSQRIGKVLKENGINDVLHLSSGGCRVCTRCAKRDDEPCRFPDLALSSLEAYGVNVYLTSQNAGLKYVNGNNTVTYFGIVLLKEDENA